MSATKSEIANWFDRGIKKEMKYLIVVCDTFEYENYPVFAISDDDVVDKFKTYSEKSMQKVEEVYNLTENREEQLNSNYTMRLPKL